MLLDTSPERDALDADIPAAPSSLDTLADTREDRAPLGDFAEVRGQVLCGTRLEQVRALQDSILRFGLLAPLTVVRTAGRLVVIDGRLRLAALRRLSFQGRLPRALLRVPFRVASRTEARDTPGRALRNAALYNAVLTRFRGGDALDAIARRYQIPRRCVRDVLGLSRLDEAVRRSLFETLITVPQARAFATITDTGVQRRVLMQLGPFATPGDIAEAGRRAAEARQSRSVAA